MNLYTAPTPFPRDDGKLSIFLAGSIENGKAMDWQSILIEKLSPYEINVFNPRRENWDATITQTKDDPILSEQINWELDALETAVLIVMYLDPNTKSPISLLELGLFAARPKMVVCCPDGFYRKGNVDIVCDRHGIPYTNDISTFIDKIVEFVDQEMKDDKPPKKQKSKKEKAPE